MSHAHVTVAEEGNRRRGDMSSSEVSQSILDIKSWFVRQSDRKMVFDPATSADLQRLEKAIDTQLPLHLRILLEESNGGLYFMDKRQLSTVDIMDAVSSSEDNARWVQGLIPFCGDESGYLAIDTRHDDQVIEWSVDDGAGDVVSSNFTRYLEQYRDELLENHFEFLGDAGVVEKIGRGHK